ncbi:20777_t:CDS:2 [Gigaspora margarita]|uniref:20777_t:CDS:1 n=1 Tax=Gigaspora margarita TaxID=4874 RepID=A0ABN7VAV4_GIGMA|nr:20777_t:CDS:2 [Gigaspora margarita]
MHNFIIGLVFLLLQLSSVNADELSFNSSFLNISFAMPLESNIKNRISWASDLEFLFMRVAPIIYQFYFIFSNDPGDEVKRFSRYYNDSVQMILPPLLLLFPSLISPYEIYSGFFFTILRQYAFIMISASTVSLIFSIYDFETRKKDEGLVKYYRYYKLFMAVIGFIVAFQTLLAFIFTRLCFYNGKSSHNIYTLAYTIRTLHFASIVYYFSSSTAYHWVTGTILFSATTSLWFANSDTEKLNPECSLIFKLDCKSKDESNMIDDENPPQTSEYS